MHTANLRGFEQLERKELFAAISGLYVPGDVDGIDSDKTDFEQGGGYVSPDMKSGLVMPMFDVKGVADGTDGPAYNVKDVPKSDPSIGISEGLVGIFPARS